MIENLSHPINKKLKKNNQMKTQNENRNKKNL